MNSSTQQRLLAAFCITAGLVALGVGGAALYTAGSLVLALGILIALLP